MPGAGAGAGVSAGPGTQTPAGGDGTGDGPVVERTGRVPGYGAKAYITVTIDLQDLKAPPADASGRTVYGDGLSAAAIRRLACDARIIPLVLGTNSEPLDVGRSERLVTRAMRRALNARDKGCVVCGAPPIMCDAHHLVSWIDGGETKVSNLVLLCRRDHTDLHNGRWTVTITDGAVHVDRPAWADPPPLHANSARRGPERLKPLNSADAFAQPATVDLTRPESAGRWKGDAASYAEAARFAVWRQAAPDATDTGPPSFATI